MSFVCRYNLKAKLIKLYFCVLCVIDEFCVIII